MIKKYLRYFVKDQLFTFFSIVFVIVYWISAHNLPMESIQYPLVITAIVVFFIVWNLTLSVRQFKKLYKEEGSEKEKWDCSLGITKGKVIVVGATVLYAILISVIGYCVSTFVYLMAVGYFLGARKPVRLICYSACVLGILYLIFKVGLQIDLPTGFLI